MLRTDLKALSRDEMQAFVRSIGWPAYRSRQILQWIYQKGATEPSQMTNLSKSDRDNLSNRCFVSRLQVSNQQRSSDGTVKFLFRLQDGQEVESVLIPGEESKEGGRRPRLTLCISTQVGCTLDCRFCLTGTMGLIRNLEAHEIIDQVLEAGHAGFAITNIVLMGMGEPLANYGPVIEAIRRLTEPDFVGFPPRRITVSTAGLVPQIRRLGESGIPVILAVSLNATTDEDRQRLMPAVNQLYPLSDLIPALRNFPLGPRKRLTIEYVMLAGENDTEADARRLVKLLNGIRCKVNLIPFNEYAGSPYRRPSDRSVLRFQQILMKSGLTTFIRKSRGRDILAACGQLRTAEADSLSASGV